MNFYFFCSFRVSKTRSQTGLHTHCWSVSMVITRSYYVSSDITGLEILSHKSFAAAAVLLFILRLMKAAGFQPRIAIMTHTVFEAWSDLIHFIIIFISVLLGFGVSGMLLFGRQNNGYATLTDSALTLLILLINWDATVWVKVQ
jgi:hypothetical protein